MSIKTSDSNITDDEWVDTQDRIIKLIRFCRQKYYYEAESPIPDHEFDKMFKWLQRMEATRPHLARDDSPTQTIED